MYHKDPAIWPLGRAPLPALCSEDERLSVLAAHGLDALEGDAELAQIVRFAAQLCAAPIALVSIVEEERQRFLAREGLAASETPRSMSFCAHAMLGGDPMVVVDAREDARFRDNPLVTGEPHIRFYAGAPLVAEDGAPLGSLCVIDTVPRPMGLTALQREGLEVLAGAVKRRLLQRRQDIAAIGAIGRREERFRRLLDSVPGIAWSATPSGKFDYFNARWQEWTGSPPPGAPQDWAAVVHPDDLAKAQERWREAFKTRSAFEESWRLRTADGDWRWMLARAVPIAEKDGSELRWVGTLIDIDESHRLSENRELIANELSHRIKNIFAVVGGLISLRSRGRPEVADFAAELNGAIKSLGLAHDYVRPVHGRSSEHLLGLLRDLLAPYDDATGDKVTVSGDEVPIGAKAATPLALIFHELATNSAKYGALSCDGGNVSVEVEAPGHVNDDADDLVVVTWREYGYACSEGDAVSEGFGSRLLRMAVENQLGGSFARHFGSAGLDIRLAIPRRRISG